MELVNFILTSENLIVFFILFARIGAVFMTLPAIGDNYVSPRLRLFFALFFTIFIYPILKQKLTLTANIIYISISIIIEITIGVLIGIIIRMIMSSVQLAGTIISMQSGLGSAMIFDPNQGSQSALVANFMYGFAIALFFSYHLDHLVIKALLESYNTLPTGLFFNSGDITSFIVLTMSKSFSIAIQLSAPVLVITMIMFFGTGILSRLMPNMQVFFILTPIQILVTFTIIFVSIATTYFWYINIFEEILENFWKS